MPWVAASGVESMQSISLKGMTRLARWGLRSLGCLSAMAASSREFKIERVSHSSFNDQRIFGLFLLFGNFGNILEFLYRFRFFFLLFLFLCASFLLLVFFSTEGCISGHSRRLMETGTDKDPVQEARSIRFSFFGRCANDTPLLLFGLVCVAVSHSRRSF